MGLDRREHREWQSRRQSPAQEVGRGPLEFLEVFVHGVAATGRVGILEALLIFSSIFGIDSPSACRIALRLGREFLRRVP